MGRCAEKPLRARVTPTHAINSIEGDGSVGGVGVVKLSSNSLDDLDAEFQPVARLFLDRCNAALTPSVVRPLVTFRSSVDQDAAKAAGLSKAGAGASPHNCCLPDGSPASRALDFGIIDPGGVYIKDGTDLRYTRCGLIAEGLGAVWGGRWQHPDYDHIQMTAWKSV